MVNTGLRGTSVQCGATNWASSGKGTWLLTAGHQSCARTSANQHRATRNLRGLVMPSGTVWVVSVPWGNVHMSGSRDVARAGGWSRDLFWRNDFSEGVLWALLIRFLREDEGVLSQSLLLGCQHSHRYLENLSPALAVQRRVSAVHTSAQLCAPVMLCLFNFLNSCFVLFYPNRLQQQWLKNSMQKAWTLR